MYICNKEDTFIVKKKFEIGSFFGKEESEVYVILKEPSTNMFLNLQAVWKEQHENKSLQSLISLVEEEIKKSKITDTSVQTRIIDSLSKIQEKIDEKDSNNEKAILSFHEMLPDLIVDSSIYETEEKKMGSKELADFLFDKFECITEIMTRYYQFLIETKSQKKTKKQVSKQ